MKQQVHNPHLQIMLCCTFFVFYNYYEFALNLTQIVKHYHFSQNPFLYSIFSMTPFAFSSLARPIGGILTPWWQRQTKHYVLPYLFILYSILSLTLNFITPLIYIPQIAITVLITRILQGILIGGIEPQYMMYCYERSNNLTQRIFYSTTMFIIICSSVLVSELEIYLLPDHYVYYLNILVSVIFFIVAYLVVHYKNIWNNFHVDRELVTTSLSLYKTFKTNYGSIIRFTFFLSFMASINSFFLSVMPFYLVHYLHYNATDVFKVVIVILIAGITGYIVGGYYHAKIGKDMHLTLGIIIKLLLYFLFQVYIHHNLYLVELLSSICLFSVGLMAAKIPLILNGIFPPTARLYAISITFNFSWGIMFGFSSFVIIGLINHFHNLYIPSLAIMLFSYLSIISLWFTPKNDFYRYLIK